jgi:hypothetical protein
MRFLLASSLLCALPFLGGQGGTAEPCQSGLATGQRPGPYSAVIATGPERGQSYCYVCETGDKPGVIVFARSLSDPLGQLVQQLDKLQAEHKTAGLRVWVTFLSNDQPTLDPEVVRWGRKHSIRSVPLGVFEDVKGPPSYRLGGGADVTVLLFVKHRVIANFAFRSGELTEDQAARVLKAVPQLVGGK